jgi:hypothetical protein
LDTVIRILRFPAAIGLILLVVVIVFHAYMRQSQRPEQILPATIKPDCAPWDGPAFTLSIPMEDASISISVYQAPDIQSHITFLFPDNTASMGNALLILPLDPPEPLKGSLLFQRVKEDNPVEGTFDFTTAAGKRFKGTFTAAWGDEVVYCG